MPNPCTSTLQLAHSQRVAAHHGPHCCGCTPTCRTAAHAARRCVGIPLGASSSTLLGISRACVCMCGTYPRVDLWLCLLRWLHFADVVALGATSRPARLRCNQRCVWESMLRRDFPATLPRASCVQVQQVTALNGDGRGIITGAAPAGRQCNSSQTYYTTPRVVRAHQSGGDGAGSGRIGLSLQPPARWLAAVRVCPMEPQPRRHSLTEGTR